VKAKSSLRWKLVLLSGSLATGFALVLTVLHYARTWRDLLHQLEKTLETKCDEVITVLQGGASTPMLQDFLHIETNYRYTAHVFLYEIRDGQGRTLARSANLGPEHLPLPEDWRRSDSAGRIHLETASNPVSPVGRVRVRSERIDIERNGGVPVRFEIQTAATLGPLEATVRRDLRDTIFVAVSGIGAVFVLVWFVTTRALRPVWLMTRKASQITAANLRERLPVAGRDAELDELARVLNDMLDRLDGSLKQMEQFSSDAAHQLRTPLTRMRGEVDLILRNGVSEPLGRQLGWIQEELERLSRVCGRLLLLSRLESQAGDGTLIEGTVDLGDLVSELVDQLTPVALDRGVALRRGAMAFPRAPGNRGLLAEALLNLLDNAIRVTPRGGSVVVSLEPDGSQVRISVEDSGPGVAPEERERIFHRFYRVPGSSPPGAGQDEGTGLGLAIVRGTAVAHHGRVEVDDAPRGGTVFRLVLPAAASS
jgi:signal transduction histidine kinase